MIVSSSSHLHHRVGGGGAMSGRRTASRCSLELLGDSVAVVASPSTVTPSKMTSSTSSAVHHLPSTSTTTSTTSSSAFIVVPPPSPLALHLTSSDCEGDDDDDEDDEDLSSPASSGYGRSTASEADDVVVHPQVHPRMTSSPMLIGYGSNRLRRGGGGGLSISNSSRRQTRAAAGAEAIDGGEYGPWKTTVAIGGMSHPPIHPLISSVAGRLLADDDIDELESLGEGFFSVVHKVRVRATGEILVRKVAKPGVRGERRATHADVSKEIAMLKKLEHENVLALRGLCIDIGPGGGWDAHLLVDYCAGGSLSRQLLDQTVCLPWRRRLSYAMDIARGMAHIHSQRVIHRDLTSMNVLIQYGAPSSSGGVRAVIADFGLSCDFPRPGEKLSQVGTTYFMSPECLKEQYYDEKSDVFSFGIILCQLIARIDADPDYGLHRTVDFGLNYVLFTSYCPPDTPINMYTLAFSCCLMDPSQRPSFPLILEELHKMSVSAAMAAEHQTTMANGSPDDLSPGRLERSRSDAALRKPRAALHQRKFSAYRTTVRPLTEGVAESSFPAMEAAARDAACLERLPSGASGEPEFCQPMSAPGVSRPSFIHGTPLITTGVSQSARVQCSPHNPFMSHARFRSARKIVPPREEERDRRQSERNREDEDEEENECDGGRRRRLCRLLRRCSSLPSEMDSPSLDWPDSSDEYDDDYDDVNDAICEHSMTNGAGAIPMAFRDYDQKFLRQSKRFSRRYTVMGSSAATAASSITAISPCAVGVSTVTSVSMSALSTCAMTTIPNPLTTPRTTGVLSPDTVSCSSASSPSYSPATGDRLNNNNTAKTPTMAPEDTTEAPMSTSLKYSSWPKRRESRIVRQEDASYASGICRSRNATASRAGRGACAIL